MTLKMRLSPIVRALAAVGLLDAGLVGCGGDGSAALPTLTEPSTTDAGADAGSDAHGSVVQTGTMLQLPVGPVQGKLVGKTREFLGLPYGQPPVGELRFAPPQPAAAWSTLRDATAFGPACPQVAGRATTNGTDEDCLKLNVYAPDALGEKPWPVMVFMHGGGFNIGTASVYDAQSLSEAGPSVVVTLNYRLNALGFLSHPQLDAARPGAPSGSDGIRDQQLALRWVRDNIGAFGGDAKNVTLFGESAGARSACVHMAAPSSSGLASRYILESGVCFARPVDLPSKTEADKTGMRLTSELCSGASDLVKCLRELPVEALANWGSNLTLIGAGWAPPVGGGDGSILPDAPEKLIAASTTVAPVIVGSNKREWGTFQLLGSPMIADLVGFKAVVAKNFGDHAAAVEAQYIPATDALANDAYIRLVTDVAFQCPTQAFAKLLSERGISVRLYSFEQGHAFHGSELDYVLASSRPTPLAGLEPTPAPDALVRAIQHYWSRFAATGDPNGEGEPNWPLYQSGTQDALALVDPPHATTVSTASDCLFWTNYFRDGGTVADLLKR